MNSFFSHFRLSIYIAYSFSIDVYVCEKKVCYWGRYKKFRDWGYFSRTDGDCMECQRRCNEDDNCGAIECGRGHCSWWKKGKCSTHETFDAPYYTCWKSM